MKLEDLKVINILNIKDLFEIKLEIPKYQRPYKWKPQNVMTLLEDISNAINDYEKYNGNFKYRRGTIILHKNHKNTYDIVDGQQRIISLSLIYKFIDPDIKGNFFDTSFTNRITQLNIRNNYGFIKEWFSVKPLDYNQKILDSFITVLEVVIIIVENVEEAFQLFDSQNTRGKRLDPHDLLKAYHLREMKGDSYEMKRAVKKWEAIKSYKIRDLFELYLFPIWHWVRGLKSKPFTANDIDTYKGISVATGYSYAIRVDKGMPCFQITEPFIAGKYFFEMIDYYIELKENIEEEIKENDVFRDIKNILNNPEIPNEGAGFKYTCTLFFCALFLYYDKFHNFDEMAIKKIFIWAFMIRADIDHLGFDTINNYAIGTENNNYTNTIDIFSKIGFSRVHNEISQLPISIIRDGDKAKTEKWEALYKKLKEIKGI